MAKAKTVIKDPLANVDCKGKLINAGDMIIENDHPDKPLGRVIIFHGGALLYVFKDDPTAPTQFAYCRDCTLVEAAPQNVAYPVRHNEKTGMDKNGRLIEVGDIVQEDGNAGIGRVTAVDNEAVIIRVFDPEENPSSATYSYQCTIIEKG